jgi:hypothetical protein
MIRTFVKRRTCDIQKRSWGPWHSWTISNIHLLGVLYHHRIGKTVCEVCDVLVHLNGGCSLRQLETGRDGGVVEADPLVSAVMSTSEILLIRIRSAITV